MGNAKLKDEFDDKDEFADELKPGSTLMHGQFTIERFLNAGGFGITYEARDSLDRRVVIKECFPGAFCRRSKALVSARSRAHQSELGSIVRLFVQEARSLAKMNHPNIVGVHQVFEENNTAYMALDFVDGRDLLDIIEDPKDGLTPDEVKHVLRKSLDAIEFIHEQGILHRDISPDNILLDADKNPVLIDFGAAREEATQKSRVLSALRVVKDGYSPQEFYIAGSDQGAYSDLYALGASFFHLLTDELPPNSQARLSAVASGDPDPYAPLKGRIKGYDDAFLSAIDKSLAILPKDRIASAGDWIDMIEGRAVSESAAALAAKKKAKPEVVAGPVGPKSRKGMLLATAAIVGLVAIGASTQLNLFGGNEASSTGVVASDTPEEVSVAPVESLEVTEPAAAGSVLDDIAALTTDQIEAADPTEVAEVAPADLVAGLIADLEASTPAPTDGAPEDSIPLDPIDPSPSDQTAVDLAIENLALDGLNAGASEPIDQSSVDEAIQALVLPPAEDGLDVAENTEAPTPEIQDESNLIDALVLTPTPDAPSAPADGTESDVAVVDTPVEEVTESEVAVLDTPAEPVEAPVVETAEIVVPESANVEPEPAPLPEVAFADLSASDIQSDAPELAEIASEDGPNLEPVADASAPVRATALDVASLVTQNGTDLPTIATAGLPPVDVQLDQPDQLSFGPAVSAVELPSFVDPDARPKLNRFLPDAPVAPSQIVVASVDTVPAALPETKGVRVAGIERDWNVSLPNGVGFSGDENAVTNVFSVNQIEVGNLDEFKAAVRASTNKPRGDTVEVTVNTGVTLETAQETVWSLSVVEITRLSNGLVFEAAPEDGTWITRVTEAPASLNLDMQQGDIMFGYLASSELLSERTDLGDILAREIAQGETTFNFAIKRGETTWAVAFPFDGTTSQ
ncbi:MAG: protein kinase [Paracoccaceae bacterium]